MSILCTPCIAACTGTASGIFAWGMRVTEIAENVANTTAPLFKNAFVYGAINGSVSIIMTTVSKTIKEAVIHEDNVLGDNGWDFTVQALLILSRYGTAYLCNQTMGSKITSNYVHIGTGIKLTTASLIQLGGLQAIRQKESIDASRSNYSDNCRKRASRDLCAACNNVIKNFLKSGISFP